MPRILRRKTKDDSDDQLEKKDGESASTNRRANSSSRGRGTRPRARSNTPSEKKTETSRSRRSTRAIKSSTGGSENGQDPNVPLSAKAPDGELLALLNRQNTLLESLIGVQERNSALLADLSERTSAGRDFSAGDSHELTVGLRPRLAIFVDVPNILYAAERSGIDLDWGKIADFLSQGRTLVRAMAYAPISDDPNARMESERFVRGLSVRPFETIAPSFWISNIFENSIPLEKVPEAVMTGFARRRLRLAFGASSTVRSTRLQ